MNIVNIGIVAHVDAGKTSLTERILYETKVIAKLGSVDQGNTQTDTLELEKRRGITIKASVVSFFFQDQKINLIDTPGHADFVAEVERSFRVLDGAILVISAVEGIQAQTKFLMAILKQLGIPTILFINKIDRMGARADALIAQIKEKLTPAALPLNRPEKLGTRDATVVAYHVDGAADQPFQETCIDLLTQHDEQLLTAYINDGHVTATHLLTSLANQVQTAKLYPIYFGSAITGVGVAELLAGVGAFFPAANGAAAAPLAAVVFKIERANSGEKIAYVRVYAGVIHVRQEVPVHRKARRNEIVTRTDKVTKLHRFHAGKSLQCGYVEAGELGKVWGLSDVKIGDVVGVWSDHMRELHLVEPQMEARIEAIPPEQNHYLYHVLTELAEEDPLIKVTKDTFHDEIYLRIFGEVQKEVLEAMLLDKYGVAVRFAETRIVCIEKPVGVGQAVEVMGKGDNPFVATVGFRVEPGAPGSGISYGLAVQLGSLPLQLHRAIEETVFESCKQGLYGWEVTDIAVTLTHTGYSSVATTAGDFRNLIPLVLMAALAEAGTAVYEPLHDFELSAPQHALSQAMFKLTVAQATFDQPILTNDSFLLTGTIPVATTEGFKRDLYAFAGGEGLLLTKPGGFRKIEQEFPTRKRADFNPLNRQEYLLHVAHAY